MKILFDNYARIDIEDPTVYSSLDASTNYPVANLGHPFLRKRYQNVTGADTITVTFAADETVNSFFVGYHNAREEIRLTEDGDDRITEEGDLRLISTSKLTMNLYSYAGVLLYTEDLYLTNQFEAIHFAAVENVRYATIVIDWSGLGAGYLGGIGLGLCYTMPDPQADWLDGKEDNSTAESSLTGQAMQDYVEPQTLRVFNFNAVPEATYQSIKDSIYAIGKGRPVWIDFTELDHTFFLPGYFTIENGIEGAKRVPGKKTWSFTLTFKEAR